MLQRGPATRFRAVIWLARVVALTRVLVVRPSSHEAGSLFSLGVMVARVRLNHDSLGRPIAGFSALAVMTPAFIDAVPLLAVGTSLSWLGVSA